MIMTHKERYTCKTYILSIHVGATVALINQLAYVRCIYIYIYIYIYVYWV